MWNVKVGDKVCCIQTSLTKQAIVRPQVGHVYTVREILETVDFEIGFRFQEIPDQTAMGDRGLFIDVVWNKTWFRPVNNIDKGMETLRGILKDPNQKIKGFEQAKNRKKAKVRT